MRLKLETGHEPDVTVTIDDAQAIDDYPQLDTPIGCVSLRIDDASEGEHSVTQAQLTPTEAGAVGEVLLQFGARALASEQHERDEAAVPANAPQGPPSGYAYTEEGPGTWEQRTKDSLREFARRAEILAGGFTPEQRNAVFRHLSAVGQVLIDTAASAAASDAASETEAGR